MVERSTPKIAWLSAHPLGNSGYSRQTREIVTRLADLGYEIYCIGGFGTQTIYGMHVELQTPRGNRVLCLNTFGDPSGRTVFDRYAKVFGFNLVITLWDYMLTEWLNEKQIPWIAQGPIDAELTSKWANQVRNAYMIVAYSKYAYKQLLKYYPPSRVRYIPHGVNTEVFRPLPEDTRQEARKRMGFPEDALVFINVSDNVPRKQLGFLLYCFKKFIEKHPHEKLYLYLHTNWSVGWPRGLDIPELIRELGLSDRVKLPTLDPMIQPIDDLQMCLIYNACDVMLHTSIAEGFGLPIIEAYACGVPAIAVWSSSMIELVLPVTGWLIDTVDDYIYYPHYVPTLQHHKVPSMNSTLKLMELALEAWKSGELEKYKHRAREFALQYDWSRIIPLWDSLLKEVMEDLRLWSYLR